MPCKRKMGPTWMLQWCVLAALMAYLQADCSSNSLLSSPFEGVTGIQEVECHQPADSLLLLRLTLFNTSIQKDSSKSSSSSNETLVTWRFFKEGPTQCQSQSSHFVTCNEDKERINVKAVIRGRDQDVIRVLCFASKLNLDTGTETCDADITLNFTDPVTAMSTEENSRATTSHDTGSVAESTISETGVGVPVWAVVAILVLLIVVIIVSCVLGFVYCRDRKKKKQRSSSRFDTMSVRSGITDKDFWLAGGTMRQGGDNELRHQDSLRHGNTIPYGEGTISRTRGSFNHGTDTLTRGGTLNRGSRGMAPIGESGGLVGPMGVSGSQKRWRPPSCSAPGVPEEMGERGVVMQYQRPSDTVLDPRSLPSLDRGYMSSSSVHYQEPWGKTVNDPHNASQLSTLPSPNDCLVQIPQFNVASLQFSQHSPISPEPDGEPRPLQSFEAARTSYAEEDPQASNI